jgi:hypothetical protein
MSAYRVGDERPQRRSIAHGPGEVADALVHARDYGVSRFVDGTRWDEPADNKLAGECGTQNQS